MTDGRTYERTTLSLESLSRLKILEHIFKKKIFNSVIDCFFYSKKNYFNLKISELICQLKDDKRFFIFYNPEIFCGVMVHSRSKELPTMMLYRTGSWVIMGGKTLSQIKECENFLLKAISKVKNNWHSTWFFFTHNYILYCFVKDVEQQYRISVIVFLCFVKNLQDFFVLMHNFTKNEYKYTVVLEILQFLMNNFTKTE